MRAAVISFPGSNCDRDMAVALAAVSGKPPLRIWHEEHDLPSVDLIALPGGFSYGDYLRCGAVAARTAIMPAVVRAAERGVYILGICNGFQILAEAGLLPGALIRNAGLDFICRRTALAVSGESAFTRAYSENEISLPIAHHDGNYIADTETLKRLAGEGRVAFHYREPVNGSADNIAGILSENRRILGMMPHPERAVDPALGPPTGRPLFAGLVEALT